jgi:hypothetical protein
MQQWIRRHPFASYYALAFGVATLVWTYIVAVEISQVSRHGAAASLFTQFRAMQAQIRAASPLLHHHADSVLLYVATYIAMPVASAAFFFPFAPTLAALLATAAGRGHQALLALLGLYRPAQGSLGWRSALAIYAAIVGMQAALAAAILLGTHLSGDAQRLAGFLGFLGAGDWRLLLSTAAVAALFNQGGLLEELGWRGYAMPLLMRRLRSPLVAVLLLGLAWTAWHLPREVPGLLSGATSPARLLHDQALFLVYCCSTSIVMAVFVNLSGGSVLPAILIHGTSNLLAQMLHHVPPSAGAPASGFSVESALPFAVLAVLVLLVAGPDLGWRRRLALHGGDGGNDPSRHWAQPAGVSIAPPQR